MHHLLVFVATNPLSQIFGPLVDLLRSILRAIEHVTGSWGLAIIGLTIIVRLILMPLTFKQFRSQQAMQAIQPKIKELQKKYKSDKRKLQEETMKLYQEYHVNPFASCLPLLLQMPIFICLYYAIKGTPEIKEASFLFIPSLGEPWLPLFAVYIITQMISTELMLTPETERQQKMIMRLMPLFFIFILFRFPAGLMLYWVTTNLWTIGQQLIIKRTVPKHQLVPAGPGKKKESRFMKAMLAAQEQQKQRGGGEKGDAADADSSSATATTKTGSGARKPGTGGQKPGATGAKSGKRPGGQQRKSGSRPSQGGQRPKKPSGAHDGRKPKPS